MNRIPIEPKVFIVDEQVYIFQSVDVPLLNKIITQTPIVTQIWIKLKLIDYFP